jgi:transposase-like protein
MSRRVYSRDEKVNILAKLQANGGNIILTAVQEGIPERTLYTWHRQFYAENQRRQSPPPSSPISLNNFADDMQVMKYLRRKIIAELLSVANTFDGVNAISPAQRMTLLAQLMDRLIKLDTHLKPYVP